MTPDVKYQLVGVLVWVLPVIAAGCVALLICCIASGRIVDDWNRAVRDLRRDRQWDRLLQTVVAGRAAYDEGPPRTVALRADRSNAVDTTNEGAA